MSYRSDLSEVFNENKVNKDEILSLSEKHNLKINCSDLDFILRKFEHSNNNNDAIYSIIESTNS